MGEGKPRAETVAPLLIELARAVRAHQFFAPDHPTRSHALKRAISVWRGGLGRTGEIELEVEETRFTVGGCEPVEGPAVDELARLLHRQRVIGVHVHPDLDPRELEALVTALAEDAERIRQRGGLPRALKGAGVRHVAIWELPPEGGPARTATVGGDAAAGATAAGPTEPLSETTVKLIKELAELEQCDDLGDYRLIANRVDGLVSRLLPAKNYVDAYRAALVLCRHVSDTEGRPHAIREEARGRLRELFHDEELRDYLMDRAYEEKGLSSVQAVQVLMHLTPYSVPRLLRAHASSDADERDRTTSILIAMGEHATPSILDELASEDPARMRRAARLLGDMQNPAAVEVLADRIHDGDLAVRREVALALARIGTDRAVRVLADAAGGEPEVAALAVGSLGSCPNRTAVRVLIDTIADSSRAPEAVRREAIRSLGRIGAPTALDPLGQILERRTLLGRKRNRPLRIAAAHAIGRIGGERAYLLLSAHTKDGDAEVAQVCREALRHASRGGDA